MKAIWIGFLLALAAAPSLAADDLSDALRAARDEFRPATAADVDRAAANLKSAKSELEQFLARDPKRAAAWRTYLQFAVLDEELARGPEADLTALDREVLARARANREGLELPPFQRYRAALDNYLETARAHREPPSREDYDARLDALAGVLPQTAVQPSAETLAEIARHVAWLRSKRQAPSLVAAVRKRFSSPNAVISMSADVMATWSVEKVERTNPINRAEDKQYTFGVGRLEGYAAAYPVPGADGVGRLELRFSGLLRTQTTTVQDKVRVQSRGVAPVIGRKPVTITQEGLAAGPMCSRVCYDNFVDCIGTTFKGPIADALVTKIAGGYIERKEGEIEADAARDAEREINEQFDEEFEEEIRDANRDMRKFRLPLLRQDLHPRGLEFHTTAEALNAVMLADRLGGTAAPGERPALAANWALGVRLHETIINNLGHTALAGRLYSIEELETLVQNTMKDLGLDSESETEAEDEEIPPGDVGIEFDHAAPVEVRFEDGVATLTIRGRRYIYEDAAYPPMNIIIRYRLENDAGVLRAVLVGEPEYTPPPGVGGLRVIALRRILRSQLNPRIDREIVQRELRLPDSDGEDEVGPLDFHQVAAENGWLTVSLRRRNSGGQSPLPQTLGR